MSETEKPTSKPLSTIFKISLIIVAGFLLWNYVAKPQTESNTESMQAQISNGVQKVTLTAVDSGYKEKSLTLKKDIPAELTIIGQTNGCASAIVAKDLWQGVKQVTKGQSQTVSFTPTKTGTFKGACAMGMYTFNIKVV